MKTTSPWSLKMSNINLVIKCSTHGNMIIYCNYNLNQTTFPIVFHQPTSQENVMGFQSKK